MWFALTGVCCKCHFLNEDKTVRYNREFVNNRVHSKHSLLYIIYEILNDKTARPQMTRYRKKLLWCL